MKFPKHDLAKLIPTGNGRFEIAFYNHEKRSLDWLFKHIKRNKFGQRKYTGTNWSRKELFSYLGTNLSKKKIGRQIYCVWKTLRKK